MVSKMERLRRDLMRVTRGIDHGKKGEDPRFWIRMLRCQLDEAEAHLRHGRRDKAAAEIADCVAVAWDALSRLSYKVPDYIITRVETRILTRLKEIERTYNEGDGYKRKL